MKTEFPISPEIYNQAAEEAAWYYRVLLNWLNDVQQKSAEDIESNDIKRLYRIHKKLHHRSLIILLGMMKDEQDLFRARGYNQTMLSEQRELLQIIVRLDPKTLWDSIKWWLKISYYMERVWTITTDILDNWWLTEQWDKLVFSKSK